MFGFKKTKPLSGEDKGKILDAVRLKVEAGSSAPLSTLIYESMPSDEGPPDTKTVNALIDNIIGYGMPDEEKTKKTDFSTWWNAATPKVRADAIKITAAYVTSR